MRDRIADALVFTPMKLQFGRFGPAVHRILVLILVWGWPDVSASGQEVVRHTLRDPVAVAPRIFGHVSGLFELSDRRLVIADDLAQWVFLVDLTRATAVQLGKQGSGPGRYKFPRALLPLGGDSVALEDVGSGWLIVVRADGTVGGSVGFSTRSGAKPMPDDRPVAGDALGRLYAVEDSSYTRKGPKADSAPITRWKAGTGVRSTVGYLRQLPPEPGPSFPGKPQRGFEVAPQLAVAADGRMAIYRVSPYSVELIGPTGNRANGKPIPYRRYRIGAPDTLMWYEELQRPRPAVAITPSGAFQVDLFPFAPSGPVIWPRFLPPFQGGAGRFAPDGQLWIQRSVPVGQPALLDVVDGKGRLVAQISAPQGSRLLGFGRSGVFLATREPGQREGVRLYHDPLQVDHQDTPPRRFPR